MDQITPEIPKRSKNIGIIIIVAIITALIVSGVGYAIQKSTIEAAQKKLEEKIADLEAQKKESEEDLDKLKKQTEDLEKEKDLKEKEEIEKSKENLKSEEEKTEPPKVKKPEENKNETTQVKLFFIARDDNGITGKKIGCGDSIISVDIEIPKTSTPLKDTLEKLFSFKEEYYGQSGLYNSLHRSSLKVENASVKDGKATINLSGDYILSGVCDNPRFAAQITETALQFSTVNEVQVFINDETLEDVISEK